MSVSYSLHNIMSTIFRNSGDPDMFDISIEYLIQTIGTIALAAIGVIFAYKKITKEWKSDDAEVSIISVMHKEIERMSAQNTALSTEIGRLHQQIIVLNQHLQELSVENQRLQAEVITLSNEVSEFKASMFLKGIKHATS